MNNYLKDIFNSREANRVIVIAPVENNVINLSKHKTIGLFGNFKMECGKQSYQDTIKSVISHAMGWNKGFTMEGTFFDGEFKIVADGKEYALTASTNFSIDDGYYYLAGHSNRTVMNGDKMLEKTTHLSLSSIPKFESDYLDFVLHLTGNEKSVGELDSVVDRKDTKSKLVELYGKGNGENKEAVEGKVEFVGNDGEKSVVEARKYSWDDIALYYAYVKNFGKKDMHLSVEQVTPEILHKELFTELFK